MLSKGNSHPVRPDHGPSAERHRDDQVGAAAAQTIAQADAERTVAAATAKAAAAATKTTAFQPVLLGRGTFGTVRLVAPHRVRKRAHADRADGSMEREVQVLELLALQPHNNIAHMLGHTRRADGTVATIDLEYAAGQTVYAWVEDRRAFASERHAQWPAFAQTLINAVQFLHVEAGVMHGDLHYNNIIIRPEARCLKLIDFGAACMPGHPTLHCTYNLPLSHRPPERTEPDPAVFHAMRLAETYSVGAILFYFYFGHMPYASPDGETMGPEDMIRRMRDATALGGLPWELAIYQSKALPFRVMRPLLQANPAMRATLDHPLCRTIARQADLWTCRGAAE